MRAISSCTPRAQGIDVRGPLRCAALPDRNAAENDRRYDATSTASSWAVAFFVGRAIALVYPIDTAASVRDGQGPSSRPLGVQTRVRSSLPTSSAAASMS